MATANIRLERDGDAVCLVGSVAGDPQEYRACVPEDAIAGLSPAQIKTLLGPRLKAIRDRKQGTDALIGSVTGTVNI